MGLEKFEGMNKKELSMIEVSREILHEKGEPMSFADLTNAVQNFLEKSDEEIRERLSQFYTDLNIDGSFISLGDNMWALRSWYPYESIDEALVHSDEDEGDQPRKRQKINAFLDSSNDDDVIDYDNDDPEDDDFGDENNQNHELKDYQNDLDDMDDGDDPQDELPDGIEGQLNEFSDDDDE
ncbi:MAG TPA: DNA-directed RNA polymerase subunit delta [Candidatus Ligilactobacillus excrementigallinarum]|uniref:Probable DNA-directed RNA polymerase subunit delta n=1 Tax=Candidatus Ligilactobacillus excrementigallinarum TaxID=2838641 RepID=A0A9D1UXE2_9LACO|nr:DNA-directed RNA polymerase subunit delta [Candidatus Ligilactobacillus excrementigallinarum]